MLLYSSSIALLSATMNLSLLSSTLVLKIRFTKPKESVNHLKSLFVRGHIDGIPIAKMLVDGGEGATVNLMPYSLYKKLGNMTTNLSRPT
jgi:hypothetical protein